MKPTLFKVALWTGSLGLCAYLLRVIRQRRSAIDVGAVSEEWLAHRRGVGEESGP